MTRPLKLRLRIGALVNLITAEQWQEAILYAQEQVWPLVHSAEEEEQLEEALSLMAYPDLEECPAKHLTEHRNRAELASLLNSALLLAHDEPPHHDLASIRQLKQELERKRNKIKKE